MNEYPGTVKLHIYYNEEQWNIGSDVGVTWGYVAEMALAHFQQPALHRTPKLMLVHGKKQYAFPAEYTLEQICAFAGGFDLDLRLLN